MTSELKSATSRANGAKSRGPKTAETREKSSHNSLQHGFTAKKTMVLQCESEDAFHEMLAEYAATYQPGSPVEQVLVNDMVAARWRMQRLRAIEIALLDSEMDREPPETEVTPEDAGYQLACAFRRLADESRAISLASRYESRLHRIHEHSHRTLRELQQSRKQQTDEPVSPVSVQPEPPPPSADTSAPERDPRADEKSRNEPTPSTPAAATKPRQHLSIARHRSFQTHLNTKNFRSFRQLKTA
jgi:hypothetical protein